MLKVTFDIVLSLLGLLILSPIMFLVSVLILILERKNPFFVQSRMGYKKTEFQIIKFRTMLDGKITPIGRVLRKTGIDELPQMVNILLLEMSFVGPRPLTVADIERLGWNRDYYERRWSVRPGIAGLSQLSPVCNAHVSWLYDQTYIKRHSFWMDLKIMFSSFAILFVGKEKVKNWVNKR
jgi:lipopolysaccharide/colanic/teichoic acid biosynthesis glycosyltransferase